MGKNKTTETPKLKKEIISTLTIGDKVYEYETDSVEEMLKLLKPEVIKGRGVLYVKKGDKFRQVVLYPLALKRLVRNSFNRNFLAKQINIAIGVTTLKDYI